MDKSAILLIAVLALVVSLSGTACEVEDEPTPSPSPSLPTAPPTPALTPSPSPTTTGTYVDGSLKLTVVDECAGGWLDGNREPVVTIAIENVGKLKLGAAEIYAIAQGSRVRSVTIGPDSGLFPGESDTGTWTLNKIWDWIPQDEETQVVGIAQDSAGTGYRVDFTLPPVSQMRICASPTQS